MTALSTSLTGPGKHPASTPHSKEPSSRRKRLHLLYLINDLLHHATAYINDASITSKVQPTLVDLFTNAASFRQCPKHTQKIGNLIDLWEEKHYYSQGYTEKLREAVRSAPDAQHGTESLGGDKEAITGTKVLKRTPFVMPATHGDVGTPWYDLPAGNLMPHIVPNSTRPINPTLLKPLRFVTGPADAILVTAVEDLLRDVAMIYEVDDNEGKKDESTWDIDELGLPIMRDSISGEVLRGEGYYGWSKDFCEKMRRRRKGIENPSGRHPDGRSRSASSRLSRSRSSSTGGERRKRRYSGSSSPGSRSRSRSRGRAERQSYSRSGSPFEDRAKPLQGSWRSRTSQQSRSRSRSPRRSSGDTRVASHHFQPGVRQWPSDQAFVDSSTPIKHGNSWGIHPDAPQDFQGVAPPPPAFISGFHHSGSGVVPVPPPPPPHFQGQWPPPLPPPPPYGHQIQQSGAWPPPPPPPQFPEGRQNWQPPSYGQFIPGPSGTWTPASQHGSGRGYGNRGRGASGGRPQQNQEREPGYGGGRVSSRGRGWSS